MGCDIHMWAEVYTDRWEIVGDVFDNLSGWGASKTHEPWQGRSYDLFAILADVRNGEGFAGCDTGNRLTPISDPRGEPDDASEEYMEHVIEYGCNGHSHSWLTIAELKAFDWQQTATHRGWVDAEQYRSILVNGIPDGWAGDVWGPEKVSNAEILLTPSHAYTKVEWSNTYAECVPDFVNHTIPALESLGDSRIVFFFDN